MPRNYVGLEEKLSRMVSIPTVAGGPYEIARYRQTLRELFPHLFRQAEEIPVGEALLLKLEGAQAEEKPVLFSGHMDVVAAPPEGWEHPPFSGEIVNGEVWGRGSLDMKGAQCALLAALDALLEESWRPQRTVYLYLSCDEEIGGPTTARAAAWLEAHGVRLEAVFDEGGTVGENFWGKIPGRAVLRGRGGKGLARIPLHGAGGRRPRGKPAEAFRHRAAEPPHGRSGGSQRLPLPPRACAAGGADAARDGPLVPAGGPRPAARGARSPGKRL